MRDDQKTKEELRGWLADHAEEGGPKWFDKFKKYEALSGKFGEWALHEEIRKRKAEAEEAEKRRLLAKAIASQIQPAKQPDKRSPGRPPRNDVLDAMRVTSIELLKSMSPRQMAEQFSSDKNTCDRMRAIVLREAVK